VSARDVQSVEMQASLGPSKGKDFDTGNILGPCIVTADSVDADDMTMIARINGEEWCRGNSGSAHWTFAEVIAHASKSETLVPGECIGSGTVGGGCGLEHGRFLNPGDVIELEVSGIGTLRNRIVRKNQ
jgi:2-keto-4-pentenoate hydratase/2-oxohepta-3-ene-1,7-dioic acid hydratase in catechol pathway